VLAFNARHQIITSAAEVTAFLPEHNNEGVKALSSIHNFMELMEELQA
jgi:hypothetical protein